MEFVDLKRRFAAIGKDEEANLEVGRFWGSEIAGWLDWPSLLERRRVALLAEAASGKTEEFRHQAAAHAERGRAGFYVRIEDLADDGFENALEPSAIERFERWRNAGSADAGWFFLDSVDEARLNRKSLDRALSRFFRALGPGLERARVYVSCRVSDWQGRADRDAIERWLPVREAPALPESQDGDAALSEETRRFREERLAWESKQEIDDREAKRSWIEFRDSLRLDRSVLSDPALLANWDTGAFRLYNLAEWLPRKGKRDLTESALNWQLLADGFGRPVAEAYRDGMKALWRVTAPERPIRTDDNRVTSKYTTILSFSGLEIGSADDPDWAKHLSSAEAERAVLHACLSEQGYPTWINPLIDLHPKITLPIMRQSFADEWIDGGKHPSFLGHFAWTRDPVPTVLGAILFETITGTAPKTPDMLDLALGILRRLDLDATQCKRLLSIGLRRLRAARAANDANAVRGYLAMVFLAEPDRAAVELADWLGEFSVSSQETGAQSCLGALFDRHEPSAASDLQRASVGTLEALVPLAYRYVPPENDPRYDEVGRRTGRNRATGARDTILDALLKRRHSRSPSR